ncbi:MAG: flagella basal body P-ring formation protein FlgA [Rhodocyclales bacterium]|nr:flagella basal body P-ring formation protein FlgA [Rhodocyclales bacterium]
MVRSLAVALAALSLGSTAFGAESVFFDVRPEATVDQPNVVVADIVRVVARDSALAEQLGSIPVGRCASLAGGCRFDVDSVAGAVEARAAELGARIVWGGTRGVAVSGRPKSVSLASAIDGGAAWLVQAYGQGAPVYVDVIDGAATVSVPSGRLQILAEPARMRRAGAYAEMPVRVLVDGVEVAQPQVRYLIRRMAAAADGKTLPTVDGVANFHAPSANPLVAGGELRSAVTRNQRVRLLIDSGPVRVEAEGVALGDALLGGVVAVRRGSGLAAVTGRAIDQGTVQVVEN